jgi:hypothetical protein
MSQPLLDATTTICRLTITGHLPLCGLPRVSLPEASLACNVPPLPKGADEWAQSPLPLELWGAPCPGVSCPLRDPTEGVADNASWSLNGKTVQYLYAYQV